MNAKQKLVSMFKRFNIRKTRYEPIIDTLLTTSSAVSRGFHYRLSTASGGRSMLTVCKHVDLGGELDYYRSIKEESRLHERIALWEVMQHEATSVTARLSIARVITTLKAEAKAAAEAIVMPTERLLPEEVLAATDETFKAVQAHKKRNRIVRADRFEQVQPEAVAI